MVDKHKVWLIGSIVFAVLVVGALLFYANSEALSGEAIKFRSENLTSSLDQKLNVEDPTDFGSCPVKGDLTADKKQDSNDYFALSWVLYASKDPTCGAAGDKACQLAPEFFACDDGTMGRESFICPKQECLPAGDLNSDGKLNEEDLEILSRTIQQKK